MKFQSIWTNKQFKNNYLIKIKVTIYINIVGVSCKTGINSLKAKLFLREKGFEAYNIIGGINSYGK